MQNQSVSTPSSKLLFREYLMTIEWKYRLVELFASLLTIIGMAIGSTTQTGNGFYMASQIFWLWLMFSRKMWGLIPLNVAMTAVEVWHLFH
jgi:hypothetical protein